MQFLNSKNLHTFVLLASLSFLSACGTSSSPAGSPGLPAPANPELSKAEKILPLQLSFAEHVTNDPTSLSTYKPSYLWVAEQTIDLDQVNANDGFSFEIAFPAEWSGELRNPKVHFYVPSAYGEQGLLPTMIAKGDFRTWQIEFKRSEYPILWNQSNNTAFIKIDYVVNRATAFPVLFGLQGIIGGAGSPEKLGSVIIPLKGRYNIQAPDNHLQAQLAATQNSSGLGLAKPLVARSIYQQGSIDRELNLSIQPQPGNKCAVKISIDGNDENSIRDCGYMGEYFVITGLGRIRMQMTMQLQTGNFWTLYANPAVLPGQKSKAFTDEPDEYVVLWVKIAP